MDFWGRPKTHIPKFITHSVTMMAIHYLALQVGKPGSSKSLALRLIHANLRGPDSSDDFFRQLPAVSMQCQPVDLAFLVAQHVMCNIAAVSAI